LEGFDVLLAVVFAADLRSWVGHELDHALVVEKAGFSKTWQARRLSITRKLLNDSRVRSVKLRMPPDSYWAQVKRAAEERNARASVTPSHPARIA
jgi:hypothetical protein